MSVTRFIAKDEDGLITDIIEFQTSSLHTKAGKYPAFVQHHLDRWFDKGLSVTKEESS